MDEKSGIAVASSSDSVGLDIRPWKDGETKLSRGRQHGLQEKDSSGIEIPLDDDDDDDAATVERAETLTEEGDPTRSLHGGDDRNQAPAAAPPPPRPHDPHDDVPDGGLNAWLQVLGSWVVLVDTWGLVNTFGVFQTYYETDLLISDPRATSSAISWIGSIQAALLLMLGVFAGPLHDAGYFRHLLIAGIALIVFGLFMTSLCTQYWQLVLAQGFTIGIGMGMCFLPSTAILAQYFRKRRALVLGISSSGSPLAGVVFPILFSRLQPRIGFGWATRVIAFILLGISIVPIAFMRTRTPAVAAGGGGGGGGRGGGHRALFDRSALREGPFVAMVVGGFLNFLCLYVPFFFLQLFAERHGVSNAAVSPFYLVTLLNAGSVIGRVLPNAVADYLGSVNMLLLNTVVSAGLLYGWLGIASQSAGVLATEVRPHVGESHLGGIIAFALLYGLFSGGIVSLMPSVIITLSADLRRVGTRMGMTFMATGSAILVGPPIAGAILGDGFEKKQWMATIGYGAAGLSLAIVVNAVGRILLYRKKHTLIG